MVLIPITLLTLLSAILSQLSATTCFVPNTSTDRRDVIQIIPGGLSTIACQTICIRQGTQCSAIQMTTTGNCVIFDAVITAAYGQCPAPFACLLKTGSGCASKPRRPIDLGYIRNYCSGTVQRAPADDGSAQTCGKYAMGNRMIYIEYSLSIQCTASRWDKYAWDDGIGSWYMMLGAGDPYRVKYYFLAAKCVRPPALPSPSCECDQLPMDLPIMSGFGNPIPMMTSNNGLVCSTDYVQFQYLRVYDGISKNQVFRCYSERQVYYANRVWMHVINNP